MTFSLKVKYFALFLTNIAISNVKNRKAYWRVQSRIRQEDQEPDSVETFQNLNKHSKTRCTVHRSNQRVFYFATQCDVLTPL